MMLARLTLSQVINSTDTGIIILDKEARIQTWNNWLTNYTNLTQEEVDNKTLNEVFGDSLNKYLCSAIENVLKNGQSTFLSPRLHKHPLPLFCDAIKDERIVVHYQPEIDLRSGKLLRLRLLFVTWALMENLLCPIILLPLQKNQI